MAIIYKLFLKLAALKLKQAQFYVTNVTQIIPPFN